VIRVGIDVGGTFTDVVAVDDQTQAVHSAKVLNDPVDPAAALTEGVRRILDEARTAPSDVGSIVHGTTLVSNTLLERRGARTALITTAGFRDILETRTEKRYDLYDFNAVLPEPLVPRERRIGVPERVDVDGLVVTPIDLEELERQLRALLDDGVESFAICFLHAYRNPDHEVQAAELIARLAPETLVSRSSEVAPQIREYQRTSTTVANAYVRPIVQRHLASTKAQLAGVGLERDVYMMVSGSVVDLETASRVPIRLVDSGAAAGALAAASYARASGRGDVISFEMGGTSAKFCVIEGGQPTITSSYEIARENQSRPGSGLAIALPATDVAEIGSGGGSIAWVDALGLLRVGPQSASSNPGPACYGRGGSQPTVTDANLVLGLFDPNYFLGGEMPLRRDLAESAFARLGAQVGMSAVEAAWGVHRMVNEVMLSAANQHVTDRGHDPRRFPLIAFGGAAPAHAVRFGRELGCPEVIVPFAAGVTSAVGMLTAPFGFDFVRTLVSRLDLLDLSVASELLREMEDEGRRMLERAGIETGAIRYARTCEMRYVGQTHEITVTIPLGDLTPDAVRDIRATYDREYQRIFLREPMPFELETTNWRVFVSGPVAPDGRRFNRRLSSGASLKGRRRVYDPASRTFTDWPVHDRYRLEPGVGIDGPAIVEERETTVVIPDGSRAVVGDDLSLRVV
jgi:N-methylhydantoinase A